MSVRENALPLSEFSQAHRESIQALVALPTPPPKWISLSGGLAQIRSRAWWEWHWQRGFDPEARWMRQRRPIPAAIRARVYDRDGHLCLHCGATENLTLDHIKPYSLGGPDTVQNLQTLCRSCNSRKGARI